GWAAAAAGARAPDPAAAATRARSQRSGGMVVRAALLAAMLLAVPPAAGAGPLTRFAARVARTDGKRVVVGTRASRRDPDGVGSVNVFDERTRRTRTLPGGCPVPAVGSGFLLSACSDQPWRVFDLAHRTDQAIAPIPWRAPEGADDPDAHFVPDIGSRWLAF